MQLLNSSLQTPKIPARWRNGQLVVIVICVSAAGFLGFLSTFSPFVAIIMAILGLLFAVLLTNLEKIPSAFGACMIVLLIGYMFLGKGFAYAGIPPVFIGELMLGFSLVYLLSQSKHLTFPPTALVILLFVFWGLLRTVPFVGAYGIDALRDAVVWGYAIFALAVSAALTSTGLKRFASLYRRLIPIFSIWVVVSAFLYLVATGLIPKWPISSQPIVAFKGGDMGVHLAGMGALMALGLYRSRELGSIPRVPTVLTWIVWAIAVMAAGSINRGGLAAVLLTMAAVMVVRPNRDLLYFIAAASLGLLLFGLSGLEIPLGDRRPLSGVQLLENVKSMLGTSSNASLEGTKNFRLEWWRTIINYTLHGPYFWTGKGFGVNLATVDGFQVDSDGAMRSPHNGHMDILARTGVPGLVIWITLQVLVAISLIRTSRNFQRAGAETMSHLSLWVFFYWIAALVNMSFDPYLEGPQGGIWYWVLVGAAMALAREAKIRASAEAAVTPRPLVKVPNAPPANRIHRTAFPE